MYSKVHKIGLEDMSFYAQHGFYSEESQIGAWFTVNVEVEMDVTPAFHSDQLDDTLNYEVLFSLVKEEMKIPSKLLEHLTQRIVDRIVSLSSIINKIKVSVKKRHPPFSEKVGAAVMAIEYQRI